jgi:exonuclease SbcD
VGGFEHIRYSGSPIALSFDEARQPKQVLLVDVSLHGLERVTPLEVPCFQPMLSVRGSLEELETAIRAAASDVPEGQTLWLEIVVSVDDYLSDLHNRIERITENLPVEVLRIRRERSALSGSLQAQAKETLDELTPDDVFARRLQTETIDEETRGQLIAMYREVVAAIGQPGRADAA